MLDPSIIIGTNQVPAVGGLGLVPPEDLEKAEQKARLAETRAKLLSSVLELQSQLDRCRDFGSVSLLASRLIAEVLSAGRVLIAWRRAENSDIQVIADSDQSLPRQSDLAAAAAEEISARGGIAILPCVDPANRHALLATCQFRESIAADNLIGAPLTDEQGKPVGAIIAIEIHGDSLETASRLLDVVSGMLTQKLAHFQTMQPRRWEQVIRSVTDPASRRRGRIAALLVAAMAAVMLVPVRYNIPANCELQPVHRRFVAAPFDGPLEKVMVRPGDVVQQGETIARINPREIEYQIAGLRADLKRAEQEKKGLMAEHDFAASKIAGLEAERIQLDTDLLDYQRDNLEIRSPLAGVVVAGDLETSEGTPLSKGETLFEIAPLGEMIVDVAIAEDDLAEVKAGMVVEFYLHALPGRNMSGTLKRIHPQAELRDHDNVFIGEVHVDDKEGVLRPGMRGRAWVHGDRHPLGWNLFHQAYFAVRRTLGW